MRAKKENPVVEPKPEAHEIADYTIIMYGVGGGETDGSNGLDGSLRKNLAEVRATPFTPKVNFTARIRYSVGNESENLGVSDYQWVAYEGSSTGGTLIETNNVCPDDFSITNPANITAFINEQIEKFPAKKYIFLTNGHGGGFERRDIQMQRTCMPDNNDYDAEAGEYVESNLTIFEFEELLKNTNLVKNGNRFEAIYTDMCLMGSIECVYQLQPYANYFIGSSHVTPGAGGKYDVLVQSLAECNLDTEKAMREFVPATVDHWLEFSKAEIDSIKKGSGSEQVLFCYDMQKLPAVVNAFAPIAKKMANHRHTFDAAQNFYYVQELLQKAYRVQNSFDAFDWEYLVSLANYTGKDKSEEERFFVALHVARIAVKDRRISESKMPKDRQFGLSICFVYPEHYDWVYEDKDGSQLDPNFKYSTGYPSTRFDQAVKWSEFLKP